MKKLIINLIALFSGYSISEISYINSIKKGSKAKLKFSSQLVSFYGALNSVRNRKNKTT